MDQPPISQQSLDTLGRVVFGGIDPDLREMIGTAILSRSMHREGLGMVQALLERGNPGLDEFAKRAQVGAQYGLQPGSDAHREYTLTGRLPQPKAPESPFSKIDPKDYTSESLKAFRSSGDPTDLVPREQPQPERDQFVGAPFAGPGGETLVRDRSGNSFVLTDRGPVPWAAYKAGTSAQAILPPPKPPAEEVKAFEDVRSAAEGALTSLDRFATTYEKMPGEQLLARGLFTDEGRANRQALSSELANIWERINKLNQNGVMNEGDLEQVRKILPDPTDPLGERLSLQIPLLGTLGVPTFATPSPSSMRTAIDTVRGIIADRMKQAQERATRQGVTGVDKTPAPSVADTLRNIQQEPRRPQRGVSGGW